MKTCETCQWAVPNPSWRFALCSRPGTAAALVSIELASTGGPYCCNEREHGWLSSRTGDHCGKEGRFWEAK